MNEEETRTIDELVTRYEFEPTLRDVYVEGATDAAIIEWFLKKAGCANASVYEISTVNVPIELVKRGGFDDGNKGRVLAFSVEMETQLGSTEQITGIVDRDYDNYLEKRYDCKLLLFTDFSCTEMYFYDEQTLGKYCHFILRKEESLGATLKNNLTPVLHGLFLVRCVNEHLKTELSWIEPEKQTSIGKSLAIDFDIEDYIHKYLNKGAKVARKSEFIEAYKRFEVLPIADERHNINGHDFIQLLRKYTQSLTKNKNLADDEVVIKILSALADYNVIASFPMFETLKMRVSSV